MYTLKDVRPPDQRCREDTGTAEEPWGITALGRGKIICIFCLLSTVHLLPAFHLSLRVGGLSPGGVFPPDYSMGQARYLLWRLDICPFLQVSLGDFSGRGSKRYKWFGEFTAREDGHNGHSYPYY